MTPCVEHKGATTKAGYGLTFREGKTQLAHRYAYRQKHGDIPDGSVVMHLCDNPKCVNVEHLRLGTQSENRKDCVDKGRANAPSGEAHYGSKLTAERVLFIRSSELPIRELAKMFGVSYQTAKDAKDGKTWRNI